MNKGFLVHKCLRYLVFFLLVFLVMPSGDPCGAHKPMILENSQTGDLMSPGFPISYPNDADCQWHIHVDDGSLVQLTFETFDVEAE